LCFRLNLSYQIISKMSIEGNPQLHLAFDFVRSTNQHIFLTGKAGTGKTTFLHGLKRVSPKRMVVVAPTGVAAINAGGVTIHSFFQLSFGPQIPRGNSSVTENSSGQQAMAPFKRFSQEKINIIRSLDLLVIDEISMVRADLLDGIDAVLRRFRDRQKPFGGVQLLMIGDLQQLAPIVQDDEWELLKDYYDTCYFFSSRALHQSSFISIELKHIYRQSDEKFIRLLNQIRENNTNPSTLEELNKRFIPGFKPREEEGYITLTTHNYQAQKINQSRLNELKAKASVFKAKAEGEFPEYMFPTDPELVLKAGAQVMFVKNDNSPDKHYYNGKIGTVSRIMKDIIEIRCKGENTAISVERAEWQNAKYALNEVTREIEERIAGRFVQFPLKLAWAITIHKSQGLTFEKAIINARQSFAHGQVYVALSRCKTLDGLVLSTPIETQSIKNDTTVISFTDQVEHNQPGTKELEESKKSYQLQVLLDLFDFKPVLWQIRYLLKLCNEHGALLLGNLNHQLQSVLQPVQTELIHVADKFERQIRQLSLKSTDLEKNDLLQERVRKACHYFLEKLDTVLIQPMGAAGFETDNKAIRKSFQSGFERLYREIDIRKSSLECCKEGFVLQSCLEARAKAAIDPGSTAPGSSTRSATLSRYPDFFRKMNDWRIKKARQKGVEISRIVSQKTLLNIVDQLPATRLELKEIKGMGGKKLQQFGKDILEMVIAYRREKGMELPLHAEKEPARAMLDSKHLSFSLFQSGKSIAEIAREREMAISTIEGHLGSFVCSGELPLDKVMDPARSEVIINYFETHHILSLGAAKADLGDAYSYSDIRLIRQYLETRKEKIK